MCDTNEEGQKPKVTIKIQKENTIAQWHINTGKWNKSNQARN